METQTIAVEVRTIQQLLKTWDTLCEKADGHISADVGGGETLGAFHIVEATLRPLREAVKELPPEPKVAVMWVTKRGTTSMIGNRYVDDYHVDVFTVADTREEGRKRALEASLPVGLWWYAPFDETRWTIPSHVANICTQQGLHVI